MYYVSNMTMLKVLRAKSILFFVLFFVVFSTLAPSVVLNDVHISLHSNIVNAQEEVGDEEFRPGVPSGESSATNEGSAFAGTAYEAFQRTGVGCNLSWANLNPVRAAIICYSELWLFVSGWLLIISGYVFDILLVFTLESKFLKLDVIENVWSTVKDFANLAFILGLIYISFSLILNFNRPGSQRLFVRLIIIALLLNFSLFASRVIIDAGNLTALSFYNQIDAPQLEKKEYLVDALVPKAAENFRDNAKRSTISGAIVAAVNPARLLGQDVFDNFIQRLDGDGWIDFQVAFTMISFAVISILMSFELLVGGFFFIGRTVWLMLLMVLSPLAFVAWFLPDTEKYTKQWFTLIVDRAFCIVPYIFAIWFILMISGATKSDAAQAIKNQDNLDIYIFVGLQFLVMYMVMKLARKQSQKMCEGGMGIGSKVLDMANTAKGAAFGAMVGGPGMVLRGTVGRGAFSAVSGQNRLGRYINQKAQEGKVGGVVARRALQLVSDQKFGTSAGYKERRDRDADKRFKEANELENLNKKRFEDQFRTNNAGQIGEGKRFKNQAEFDAAAKEYGARESRKASTDTLRQRAGIRPTDGRPDDRTGILGRMYESGSAGLTDATAEAYRRRESSEKKDEEKRAEQRRIKDEREERAYDNNRLDRDNKRAAAASAQENKDAISNNSVQDVELSDTMLEKLTASYGKETVGENGEKKYPMDAQTQERFNKVVEQANDELKAIAEDAAGQQKVAQESLRDNLKSLEDQNEIIKTEGEQLGLLQDILRDMENNNDQAELSPARREALAAAGIDVPVDQAFTDPSQAVALKDIVREKTTSVENAVSSVESLESTIAQDRENLAAIQEDTAKKVDDVYSYVTKTAKDRLAARADAQNSIDISRMARAEGATLEFQKQAGDIESFEQDARVTDIGKGS